MNITYTPADNNDDENNAIEYKLIIADNSYSDATCEDCGIAIVENDIVFIHDDHTFYICHTRCAIIATS